MNEDFIKEVEEILHEKSLLKHPFYKLWEQGRLSKSALQGYARQYYFLERAFPGFLLKTYEKTKDKKEREVIIENYKEETNEKAAHVDLWLDFTESLDLKREEVKQSQMMQSTSQALKVFEELSQENFFMGMGALLAYENNLQETAATKIDGLRKFYGIAEGKAVKFFEVHGVLDLKHANDWKEIIKKKVKVEGEKGVVLKGVTQAMDALWHFLDGVHEKYNSELMC